MKKVERFWNIVYYFACHFNYTLYLLWLKINPVTKSEIEEPAEFLNEHLGNRQKGINISRGGLMFALPVFTLFSLLLICANRFHFTAVMFKVLLFISFAFCIVSTFFLLFFKEKYLKYFKEFEKNTKEWHSKWAIISFFVIIIPFLMIVFSFWLLSK